MFSQASFPYSSRALAFLARFTISIPLGNSWGTPFIDSTYLYHLRRLDHRHNFSAYFLPTYLSSVPSVLSLPRGARSPITTPTSTASDLAALSIALRTLGTSLGGRNPGQTPGIATPALSALLSSPLLSFGPQLGLAAYLGFALGKRDPAFACAAQTVAFVAWNKVCTSQVCSVLSSAPSSIFVKESLSYFSEAEVLPYTFAQQPPTTQRAVFHVVSLAPPARSSFHAIRKPVRSFRSARCLDRRTGALLCHLLSHPTHTHETSNLIFLHLISPPLRALFAAPFPRRSGSPKPTFSNSKRRKSTSDYGFAVLRSLPRMLGCLRRACARGDVNVLLGCERHRRRFRQWLERRPSRWRTGKRVADTMPKQS